jgi:hypothetical protein
MTFIKYLLSYFRKPEFDFTFDTKGRTVGENQLIFNALYGVYGFKEMLANDIYQYRRRFIESEKPDPSCLYVAEAYQRLLDKMTQSHKEILAKQVINSSMNNVYASKQGDELNLR